MEPSRFSEVEIVPILKEQEAGSSAADVWRRHGLSGAIFYKRKAKLGRLEVSDAKWLRQREPKQSR